MIWGLKNSAGRVWGQIFKNKEWYKLGIKGERSQNPLGRGREQFVSAVRFERCVGTSFGMALSITLIDPAFILWIIRNWQKFSIRSSDRIKVHRVTASQGDWDEKRMATGSQLSY